MNQGVINLYDRFTHGGMSRREFLDRLTEMVGSGAAAAALVPLLQSNYAQAAIIAPDDARLAIDTASYEAGGVKINGYLARLKEKRTRPAVIVIHENRGLTPHILDVTRRIAAETDAMILASLHGVHPDMRIAYRHVALPIAVIAGSVIFVAMLVTEIRHYRQTRTLTAIERLS